VGERATVPDVAIVGDLMTDILVDADSASSGDPHGRIRFRPGGSAANAAVWALAAGASVQLFGRVGRDAPGEILGRALSERGVDARLALDQEAPTGAMIALLRDGDSSTVADPGANARLSPHDLPPLIEAGALLISGYTLLHTSSEPAGRAALERARSAHVAVGAASRSLLEARGAGWFFDATQGVTLLLAGKAEAAFLTEELGERAAEKLAARYGMACVTLGPEGALLAADGRVVRCEAPATATSDAVGAGDAFAGTLLAAVALETSIEEALERACRAGADVAARGEPWPAP
jgi:sugar/nucleoside kinase (ribokinase family)